MTKAEIIDETVEYYKNHPRAKIDDIKCTYKREDGAKCAVGRCVDPEKFEEFHNHLYEIGKSIYAGDPKFNYDSVLWKISIGTNIDLDQFLQNKYKGHDKKFWSELQMLHDFGSNWKENGELTPKGERIVERLKKIYNEV